MTQAPRSVCFRQSAALIPVHDVEPPRLEHALHDEESLAVAALMQVLCCGEESAILAFDGLSKKPEIALASQRALQSIAADEMRHDQLLWHLRSSLLPLSVDSALQRKIKHFFISIATKDLGLHYTKIAALDSGVCIILSALTNPKTAVSRAPALKQVYAHIHRDEARHVATTLQFACTLSHRDVRMQQAEQTRDGLRHLMRLHSSAMERLGMDADRLDRDLAKLPQAFAA